MMTRRRSGVRLLAALATWACGAGLSTSSAQEPAPDAPPVVSSLTTRYRLREVFTTKANADASGATGQNQVAFRETQSTDDPKDRGPLVIRAIYSERPAVISPVDDRVVTDCVRHYSRVDITPEPKTGSAGKPLDDLTVWYRQVANAPPQMIVLTPGRSLREEEYKFAINYDFVNNLVMILPDGGVRVGDSWKVPKSGAVALVNNDVRAGALNATLAEVKSHPSSPNMQMAVINVTGRITTGYQFDVSETAVNARLQFSFTPRANDAGGVDGVGFIEKLLLAQVSNLTVPGLTTKKVLKRDLNLERKRPGTDPPIEVPATPPRATPENAWLTWNDPPKGRFSVKHPQEFQPAPASDSPDAVDLKLYHPENNSFEAVRLVFTDRPSIQPDVLFKERLEEWRRDGSQVVPGLARKIPVPDRPDLTIDHMEAAVTSQPDPNRPPIRRYCDLYVVQFARNASLFANAFTFQDQPDPFRKQVQAMLMTVQVPTNKAPKAPPAAPPPPG